MTPETQAPFNWNEKLFKRIYRSIESDGVIFIEIPWLFVGVSSLYKIPQILSES